MLAIELLAACQALEFLRPLKTTTPLEKVYELLRSVVRSDTSQNVTLERSSYRIKSIALLSNHNKQLK